MLGVCVIVCVWVCVCVLFEQNWSWHFDWLMELPPTTISCLKQPHNSNQLLHGPLRGKCLLFVCEDKRKHTDQKCLQTLSSQRTFI